jgi:pimeloyl-ACP methyl ester carboxylesterase
MTLASVELPAGTIHYQEAGPADGPVVVLLHGLLVGGSVWGTVPDLLAARGYRTIVPTLPLGSHRTPMRQDADLSPRGIARIVLSLLEKLGLEEVTLVGNDTGGAVCQLVLDEDASRVGRLVLTNCDAYEAFPPFPFGMLFRLARHPQLAGAVMGSMRSDRLRTAVGFGPLARRPLTAEETRPWVATYLADPRIRGDVAAFARGWKPGELNGVSARMAMYAKPVLLCWGAADRFFTLSLGRRLAETFPDVRLVELPDARTFVALDQPEQLAEEIAGFVPLGPPEG